MIHAQPVRPRMFFEADVLRSVVQGEVKNGSSTGARSQYLVTTLSDSHNPSHAHPPPDARVKHTMNLYRVEKFPMLNLEP